VCVKKGSFEMEALIALSHIYPSMYPLSARTSKVSGVEGGDGK